MHNLGKCKLCLAEGVELCKSHFMPRKFYYSARRDLEYVSSVDSGVNPEELQARLLCKECEKRFNENGENEVLKHIAPKLVLKSMPLVERMKSVPPCDGDPTAPRYDAAGLNVDTDKFAYFALSIVWRRTIHDWHPAIPKWELGEFAEDMRKYLLGETTAPNNMAVIVVVCSDEISRRTWTVPEQSVEMFCLNFRFQLRGILFRVMMGHLPPIAYAANCRNPRHPIYLADCSEKTQQTWENAKAIQSENQARGSVQTDLS